MKEIWKQIKNVIVIHIITFLILKQLIIYFIYTRLSIL